MKKLLLIIPFLISCVSFNGGTKGQTKYQKVQCPVYPQYTHYVRSDGMKNKNPEACPMIKKTKNNLP